MESTSSATSSNVSRDSRSITWRCTTQCSLEFTRSRSLPGEKSEEGHEATPETGTKGSACAPTVPRDDLSWVFLTIPDSIYTSIIYIITCIYIYILLNLCIYIYRYMILFDSIHLIDLIHFIHFIARNDPEDVTETHVQPCFWWHSWMTSKTSTANVSLEILMRAKRSASLGWTVVFFEEVHGACLLKLGRASPWKLFCSTYHGFDGSD